MELQCTKKLLDWIGAKPQKSSADADPLFAWTANLITVNRRKTLVAVNVLSRCMFVLHGLTAKDLRVLPDRILEGIRTVLRSEYVSPEIIERYLDDCGREVIFTANSSRSVVANCNKACERLTFYADLFYPNDMFQQHLLPRVNYDLLPKYQYAFTYDVLLSGLRERYGAKAQSCHSAELEVMLALREPCKRMLVVPSDLNFYQLHKILQKAFEWHDQHLHQFVLACDDRGTPTKLIPMPDAGPDQFDDLRSAERLDGLQTTVRDVFSEHGTVLYEYDFGDGWIHVITLKRFLENCSEPYPHCTEAIGDAPMEDCGGPDGFEMAMNILRDPAHPEHRDVCDWLRRIWWRPVDLDLINCRLKSEHREHMPVYYDDMD